LGIEIRGKNEILGNLHDFRIFFIGKGSFYQTLGKARKIPGLLLYNYHLLLENEWNVL
jgi:hypothetical protein